MSRWEPRPPRHWSSAGVAGLTPATLASRIDSAKRGDLESWADTVEGMLSTDPHVRAVWETMLRAVSGSELYWEPAETGTDRDAALAKLAAEHMTRQSAKVESLGDSLFAILHGGAGLGIAVAEQCWRRDSGGWHLRRFRTVHSRDIRFDRGWTPRIRTYADNTPRWIDLDKGDWTVYAPGTPGLRPSVGGILLAVAWPWIFKKWATLYQQGGLERFADPLLVGVMGEASADVARDKLHEGPESLASGHVATLEVGQDIKVISAGGAPTGEAWRRAIQAYNHEITKGIQGSTLNVEVGTTGGNRALGESQAETTILPRQRAMAASLGDTLVSSWAVRDLHRNRHLFGGALVPIPKARFLLQSEEAPAITELHVNAGVITRDELRASAGLERVGGDWGKRYVVPVAKKAAKESDLSPADSADLHD